MIETAAGQDSHLQTVTGTETMSGLRDIMRDMTDRLESALDDNNKVHKTYSRSSAVKRKPDCVHTVKSGDISTENVRSSGNQSNRAAKKTCRQEVQAPVTETCTVQQTSSSWQKPVNSWRDISKKFGLENCRYETFRFLEFLDLNDKYTINYINYQLGIEKPIITGRLNAHLKFWKQINAPKPVLDIIENGVKIPFIKNPPPIYLPNNKSALLPENRSWVKETLLEFLDYGFISKVDKIPYCCLPLQVAVHPTKLSLIHDQSCLNEYVEKQKFKLTSWEPMFEIGKIATNGIQFDLKKYYFHIPINSAFKKFFGFSFKMSENEEITYFQFNCLPYGYTRAPLIAKEIMKPLLNKWRHLNILVSVYFDDGLALDEDIEFLKKASLQIQCDLLRAGLIPGLEKCFWTPQKVLIWNGIKWDFSKGGISICQRNIDKLKEKCKFLKEQWPRVTYRQISKCTGLINSMYPVFNGREQLRSRFLQTVINIRHCNDYKWDSIVETNAKHYLKSAEIELEFWFYNAEKLNFRAFQNPPSKNLAWVDASNFAIAGIVTCLMDNSIQRRYLSIDNLRNDIYSLNDKTDAGKNCSSEMHTGLKSSSASNIVLKNIRDFSFFHRMLNKNECKTDSNERELLAGKETMFGSLKLIKNGLVTIHFDNANAAKICTKGSTKIRLHLHALELDDFCLKNGIKLNCVNIPRDLNKFADELSKIVDYDDYSVTNEFFGLVEKDFNIKFNFDRFADNFNTKSLYFNSKTYCLGSMGVDCFNYEWSKPSINWIFPPPSLLIKSLNHLRESKGVGAFLTPQWKNSDFYPFFAKNFDKIKFFKKYPGKNVFKHGADKASHFGPNFNCAVNVWLMDFS